MLCISFFCYRGYSNYSDYSNYSCYRNYRYYSCYIIYGVLGLEIFGPEVCAIEDCEAIIFVEFIEDEELASCAESHVDFFVQMTHDDVIDFGVCG